MNDKHPMAAGLLQRLVLWTAMLAALASSWAHVASAFAGLERGGAPVWLTRLDPYVSLVAALAVDLGLIGLAHGVGARRRAGAPTRDLWAGILFFVLVSTAANVDHGLSVAAAGRANAQSWALLDGYERARVLILSACLPLMVLFLARVVETMAIGGRADVAPPLRQSTAEPRPVQPRLRRRRPPEQRAAAYPGAQVSAEVSVLAEAILAAVSRYPGATITDIAHKVERPRQTVSRHVARLLAQGRVARSEAGGLVSGQEPT